MYINHGCVFAWWNENENRSTTLVYLDFTTSQNLAAFVQTNPLTNLHLSATSMGIRVMSSKLVRYESKVRLSFLLSRLLSLQRHFRGGKARHECVTSTPATGSAMMTSPRKYGAKTTLSLECLIRNPSGQLTSAPAGISPFIYPSIQTRLR